MTSGVLMMGAAYAVRLIVLRSEGLEGAGLYQAGWTLGGLYVGFILQAMGTDFYPRLVGHINDHRAANQAVNEQARVGMLLAGPGVIATLVLGPLLTSVLYSERFIEGVEVLRWICVGMSLRVITWPIGYVVVAKNQQLVFIAIDLAWTVVNVGLSFVLVPAWGLVGAGVAFFAAYCLHAVLLFVVVRRMTGFAYSSENTKSAAFLVLLTALAFIAMEGWPPAVAYSVGLVALAASCAHSLHTLIGLAGNNHLPRSLLRVLGLLRVVRAEARPDLTKTGHPTSS
jgi:PST family polysaccharide transporter